ncbi:LysR substrate-binding domain-containing protein [Bradyrhizobium sp. CER78]|uniref:LysR substrate-binding domain-containing protein n=1 Tax=Bradyrhizobium sp. CER78 TaxID=3039162 RepID=UPI00244ABAE8|nr:LysR substrate-binding domain-containing protein [Bradyrhizobium sp. CER78]MDH2380793.1 LysR substrate-binding domain-containing protein [Bradyrhizobium sp. CER78]
MVGQDYRPPEISKVAKEPFREVGEMAERRRDELQAFGLRQLRYVIAAADNSSFRKAAIAIGVQESAVAFAIWKTRSAPRCSSAAAAESGSRMRVSSLSRGRGGPLNQINYVAIDAASPGRGETGKVLIGIFTSLATSFLAQLLRAFVDSNKDVRPELVEGGPATHMAAIQNHQLDVAFLTGRPKGARLCTSGTNACWSRFSFDLKATQI